MQCSPFRTALYWREHCFCVRLICPSPPTGEDKGEEGQIPGRDLVLRYLGKVYKLCMAASRGIIENEKADLKSA